MQWLSRNISVVAIATLACALAWLYGGTKASVLSAAVPWLCLVVAEVAFFFPQRHEHETTYGARVRVLHAVARDPVTWISVGLIALLAVPFVNTGLCPTCDFTSIASGVDPNPPVPVLPFCVNRVQHLNVFLWFLASLTATAAVRHALRRRGKRLLMLFVVTSGMGLAILGAIQQLTGAKGPLWVEIPKCYFFSSFGYPNMAGDYFTTLFALAFALWRRRVHENRDEGWRRHFMLIPMAMFFLAALATLSRASIILILTLGTVFYVHTMIVELDRMKPARRVKALAWSALAFVTIALAVMLFLPENLEREIDTLNTTEVLNRVTGRGQYHVRVATEIWKDHPLFGCGGWGYKHFCLGKMTPEELNQIQMVGGINVHNDYLQFLAEHGLVGFGALVVIVVFLALPVIRKWMRLANGVRFVSERKQPPAPQSFFVFPASAFALLTAAAATLVHAFGDCVLRSPAVLTLFLVELAAADGFLPHLEEQRKD